MPAKLPADGLQSSPDLRTAGDDEVLAVIRNAIETLPPEPAEPPAPRAVQRPDPMVEPPPPRPLPMLTRARQALGRWLLARIRAFQPKWWHSALLLALASHLHNPWLLPFMFLLLFTISGMIYFAVGPDRVADMAAARYARLQQRNPAKAERLRARAERLVQRLSRLVALLPERWTQGLNLPEFATPNPPHEKMGQDPFDRLATEARDS